MLPYIDGRKSFTIEHNDHFTDLKLAFVWVANKLGAAPDECMRVCRQGRDIPC